MNTQIFDWRTDEDCGVHGRILVRSEADDVRCQYGEWIRWLRIGFMGGCSWTCSDCGRSGGFLWYSRHFF